MNINTIENNELSQVLEKNPEANLRDIVNFCIQKFDNEIATLESKNTKKLRDSLEDENLRKPPRKLEDIMEPYVKQ